MDCTAQLTDFMPAYNVVRHPCECRRFAVRFAAGTFGPRRPARPHVRRALTRTKPMRSRARANDNRPTRYP